MTNPPTEPTDLDLLYEAMVECGIDTERITRFEHEGVLFYMIYDEPSFSYRHVLFILRGIAEEWLLDRGWNLIAPGTDSNREYEHDESNSVYLPLPEALRYAHERC